MLEETKEGLNIELVDQDGRSMFPEASKVPYERTRIIVEKLAEPLKAALFRITITGHTAARREELQGKYGKWELALDRANAVRDILEGEGYPSANFYKIASNADNDPLFPEDPKMAANRRVTITLVREAPPIPPDLQP
jgi:chemotaxis protein MotB